MADRYRLVARNHYHDGERVEQGEVFEPTDAELRDFGHKFEPVDQSPDSSDSDSPESDSPTDESDESDDFDAESFYDAHNHWREVVTAIESGDVDEHLEQLRAAEQARDSPRSSVLSALNERQA